MLRVLLLPLAATLAASHLEAHPEIEAALDRVNAEIAARPADAALYLLRGELYARHEIWDLAEANYLFAAEIAPQHPRLPRLLGTLALATHRAAEAAGHFDAALALAPGDPELLVLRARARAARGERAAAAADLAGALARIAEPPPGLFLERAALLDAPEAVRCLDEGVARLGPAVSLHLRALALEESLGRWTDALRRIDQLAAQGDRRESWLKRRGDVLARAGRAVDARAAYAAALQAIDMLPDWLRTSPDTVRLHLELLRLVTPPPDPP